jgi:hypothetical protein
MTAEVGGERRGDTWVQSEEQLAVPSNIVSEPAGDGGTSKVWLRAAASARWTVNGGIGERVDHPQ